MNWRKPSKPLWALARLVFHCIVAMIVASVLAVLLGAFVGAMFASAPRLQDLATAVGVASPFLWGPGAVLGFLVNKTARSRLACWVWLPGVVWVVNPILASIRDYDPRYSQGCTPTQNMLNEFFILNSHRCGGASTVLTGLFFVLPALNAIAYSIGAAVALIRVGHNVRGNRRAALN